MPLMNTPFEPGHCQEAIEKIEDPDLRNIALAEYYYFGGQSEKAALITEHYLSSEDLSIRLSACWIHAYANLALNKISNSRKALNIVYQVLGTVDASTEPKLQALTVFVSTAAAVLLHLPVPEHLPPLKKFIWLLPPGLRIFALYVLGHHAYLEREYSASIGIVETALALRAEMYPIPSIYLHLVAAMDYISLKKTEQAREHLLAAWKLAKPDDFIEPFGEHHGLLGGMLEAVLKKEFPEDFRRMISITYNFSAGWRKVHNSTTGNSVADNLTTTEFAAAMLAARGWSNKEISVHMGISPNTVKQHISVALQKVGVEQRKELAQFMLK